jgi:predicted CXXCH cytochrome family protein
LLYALVLVVGIGLAFTPLVPPVGAIDPTASPAPDQTPTAVPDPTATAVPDPTVTPAPDPTPAPAPDPVATPAPEATIAPPEPPAGPFVAHVWVDDMGGPTGTRSTGGVDAPRSAVERFHVYVVRFQVVNETDADSIMQPALAIASGTDGVGFSAVPAVDPVPGSPFYAASDLARSYDVRTLEIAVADMRLATSTDPIAIPTTGSASWGANPGEPLALPAHSFTEVEFAVRATADAEWLAAYQLRLMDGSTALDGPPASLIMRAKPAVRLSPGQRSGTDVETSLAYPLDLAASQRNAMASARLSADGRLSGVSYGLLASPLSAFDSPHGDISLTSDTCAACHSGHRAQGVMLLREAAPQATLCFRCHDGSGAVADIEAQYTDPTVPANDSSTSRWYSHAATGAAAVTHRNDRGDEFSGRLDRHASCADCHQPHIADASLASETVAGWTASGALAGAAGVSVVNGGAGTSPTYTLNQTTAYEYELCFKCHSGFTQLLADDPAHPSRWSLDKAVELNPANLSFHPIEAPGTNQPADGVLCPTDPLYCGYMTNSLHEGSPYKLWNFDRTSTIRCTNCHGDSRLATPLSPPDADARLAPHAVKNQGILIANYRIGDLIGTSTAIGLKPATQPYAAADFALCYTCHAEEPFVDPSGDPVGTSNFGFHGLHTYALTSHGTGGRDIDTAGAGQGNALCSECHFRIHGNAYPVSGQTPTTRLVNFAPDVLPYLGVLEFDSTAQTCTLTCHGKAHTGFGY